MCENMSKVTELLQDYAFWDDMVRRARRELDRQHEQKTSIKISYSDMPRGGSPETMEDYIVKRSEMEMEMDEIKERRHLAFSQILRIAVQLKSTKQIDIIYRRDIHRDSWRRICRDLDIKRSAATDLHERAIRAMERIVNNNDQDSEYGQKG